MPLWWSNPHCDLRAWSPERVKPIGFSHCQTYLSGETWQLQRQNAWLKEVGDFVHNQRVRPRHWPQDLTLKKLYFSCESTQDCQESIAKFALIYRYPTCLDSECWRHILKLPPKLLVRLIDWSRKKFVWLVYVIFKYAWRLSAMFRSKPRSLDAFAAQ